MTGGAAGYYKSNNKNGQNLLYQIANSFWQDQSFACFSWKKAGGFLTRASKERWCNAYELICLRVLRAQEAAQPFPRR